MRLAMILAMGATMGPVGGCSSDETYGGSSGGKSKVDEADFCEDWGKLCPEDAAEDPSEGVAFCQAQCEGDPSALADSESCWFRYCSVEAGKCDGEEDDDARIIACAEAHGWK